MFFQCRESCGSCGFKSPTNNEIQKVKGKQFTDVTSKRDYFCGSFKNKEQIKEVSLDQEAIENAEEGLCSAVVISDRFALTAAHCLEEGASRYDPKKNGREVSIRVGTGYQ